MAIKPDYQAGLATLAAGGTTVTFSGGANITAADIQPGDTFKVQNLDAIIASVTDATHVELAAPWTGTALTSAPYRIRFQPDGSRFTAAARDLIAQLGNGNLQAFSALAGAFDMIPIFTGTGALTLIPKTDLTNGVETDAKVATLAARAAYNASPQGFSVLVADVGDGRAAIYYKQSATSGDWSPAAYLTGANGSFQSKGVYNGATSYVVGDVVLQNGSSWIARVNTTGNPPPTLPTTSNTQWFLLSAAGNTFTIKGAYNPATAYLKDDVVTDGGSSWIALQSTTGNAPPILPTQVNAWWQLLISKGNDGAIVGALVPQGRVTLTSGVAITTADVAGAATIYYTPCTGDRIPIHNGTSFINTTFPQLALALDPTAAHTNYHQNGLLFDLFVINDGGTVRLGSGPKWTTTANGASSRGAGAGTTELELYGGILVNKNAITIRFGSASGNTVSVAARQATFVGTFYTSVGVDGLTEDSRDNRYLANAYNRVERLFFKQLPAGYFYSSTTRRPAGGGGVYVGAVQAVSGDLAKAHVQARASNSTVSWVPVRVGIGVNQNTTYSNLSAAISAGTNGIFAHPNASWEGSLPIGISYFVWMEEGAGVDAQTWAVANNCTGIWGSVNG